MGTMNRALGRSGLALFLLILACGGGSTEEPSGGAEPVAPGAEVPVDDDLAEVAGDWALATLFFQPERWPEVRDAIRGLLASEPPTDVQRMLSAPLDEALAMAGARPLAAALNELRGVDPERPMVVRYGETTSADLEPVVEAARAEPPGLVEPGGIRHVLAVPAADPDQLEPSLRRAFIELCSSERWVNDELECRGWTLRIEAESRWVFVVFGELEAPLRGSGQPSGTLRWAMDARWPAAAYFRRSKLRSMAVRHGLRQMSRALAHASTDYRGGLTVAGLGEVVMAHSRTAPYRADLDEGALAIRSAPGALLFLGHLTPHATDALAREAAEPGDPSPRTERQHLEIRSALPLRLAARAVAPPFALDRDSPQAAARSATRCGPFCFFGAMVQPLGAARLLTDLNATEVLAEYVRYVNDPSVGAGGLRAHLDLEQIGRVHGDRGIRQIAALVPALHLEARVEGPTLAGAIAVQPQPRFEVPPLADGERSSRDPAQVRCLEQLETSVIGALGALAGVDPSHFSRILEAGKAEASATLGCITDAELRNEATSYLEALETFGALLEPEPEPEPQNLSP